MLFSFRWGASCFMKMALWPGSQKGRTLNSWTEIIGQIALRKTFRIRAKEILSFSKGFVVLQTTWFVSQCIARGVAGLVVTELELATFAFAVLNGILYFLWRNKPLDVSCPIPIYLRHPTSCGSITFALRPEEQRSYADNRLAPATREERHSSTSVQHSSAFERLYTCFCELLKGLFFALKYVFSTTLFHIEIDEWPTLSTRSDRRQSQMLSVPTFYAPSTDSLNRARLIGLGIGVLFGGIHCIAWSFKFPSVAEQFMWRISAVNVTVIPIIIATPVILIIAGFSNASRIITRYTFIPFMVVYATSRVALLILPLIALRSLPPASLVEFKWSAFIPHI
jgi:hypothetical protein